MRLPVLSPDVELEKIAPVISEGGISAAIPPAPELRIDAVVQFLTLATKRFRRGLFSWASNFTITPKIRRDLEAFSFDAFRLGAEHAMRAIEHRYVNDPGFEAQVATRFGSRDKVRTSIQNFFLRWWEGITQAPEAKPLRGLDEKSELLLFQNCKSIQLTDFCSVGCSFCGLNAKREGSFHFSQADLHRLVIK